MQVRTQRVILSNSILRYFKNIKYIPFNTDSYWLNILAYSIRYQLRNSTSIPVSFVFYYKGVKIFQVKIELFK